MRSLRSKGTLLARRRPIRLLRECPAQRIKVHHPLRKRPSLRADRLLEELYIA